MTNEAPGSGYFGNGIDDWLEGLKSGIPDYLATPWPDLDPIADIAYNNRIAFVAQRGQHEATIGRRLAAHVVKTGPVLLFTGYPPTDIPDGLVIDDTACPSPRQVQEAAERMQRRDQGPILVVVERFERMALPERPEGLTRVEELEEVGSQLRHARVEIGCPLVITTVSDEVPNFRQHIIKWAGVDSPAAILTDYCSRVIVLRRLDDETVEAVVEADDYANPNAVERIAWTRPAGAKPPNAVPPQPVPLVPRVPPTVLPVAKGGMVAGVQALETEYAGHYFRSRLEARWAVFFDALGIPWEYEAERYQLPSGKYLPDFWLPRQEMFYEVKGVPPTDAYRTLLEELAQGTGHRLILAVGSIPSPDRFEIGEPGSEFWLEATDVLETHVMWAGWQAWCQCPTCGAFDVQLEGRYSSSYCGCHAESGKASAVTAAVLAAFRSARSARFEHGQSGATL
jgi:hypothetical protein